MLNLTGSTAQQAAANCAAQGGHLVTYADVEEQAEVEAALTAQGVLLTRWGSQPASQCDLSAHPPPPPPELLCEICISHAGSTL